MTGGRNTARTAMQRSSWESGNMTDAEEKSKTGINEMAAALKMCNGNPCHIQCGKCQYRGHGGCVERLHQDALMYLVFLAQHFLANHEKRNESSNGLS